MDSGVAVLFGALVGGGASFAATFLQARLLNRQQRVRTAADLAVKEHEFDLLLHKEGKKLKFTYLAEYVAFHNAALEALEKGEENTPDQLDVLAQRFGVYAE